MKFRYKLFFVLLAGGGLIGVPVWYLLYVALSHLLTIEIPRSMLLSTAAQAVHRIDPRSVEELIALPEVSRRGSPAYAKLRADLNGIIQTAIDVDESEPGPKTRKQEIGDAYILIRENRSATGRFLLSLQNPEIEGRDYDMSRFPAMMRGWDQPAADDHITADEYGEALSIYAPIKNASGQTIALLGYDAPSYEIISAQALLLQSAAFLGGVVLCMAAVVALGVAWWINRPILRLHDGLEAVASGNLDVSLPPTRSRDELGQLVRHFNQMTEALRERRTIKRSLEVAAEVQRYLLPHSAPSIAGWDIFGQANYCDETGGDFYDFVPLPNGRLAVLLGDASGHGIGSALVMATVRAAARNIIRAYAGDPDRIITELNRVSVEDLGSGRFITLCAMGLTPGLGAVNWISAGHEPCLHLSGGRVTELRSTGIALGIDPDATHPSSEQVHLANDDVLLLFSDGVSEARNGTGEFLGRESIKQWLIGLPPGMTAEEIHRHLYQQLLTFTSPRKPQDDVTIVVVRRIAVSGLQSP